MSKSLSFQFYICQNTLALMIINHTQPRN